MDFAPQIRRFLDVFPREQLHVVLLEDMARAPAETIADVVAFLDLPHDEGLPGLDHENPARRVRVPILNRVMYHPPPKLATAWRRLVPASVSGPASDAVARWNLRRVRRDPVPKDVADPLRAELAPMVRELEQMLGRDLREVWGF
jgi:hypothetical protein